MLVGPLEAAFLQFLVCVSGARHILEIGTFTGYSALAMAEALPPDGRIVTCEANAERAEIARGFFQRSAHANKIAIRVGPALQTIAAFSDERPLDLVFIDADKENYLNYYERALPKLKTGGIIVADNVLWSGRVLDPREASDRAIVEFNDVVGRDPRVECIMVPLRDGVSLIRKR